MSVVVERNGPVATVVLDRTSRRNAVDREHADELHDVFRSLDGDDDVSVIVFYGAGGNFCAGADLKALGTAEGVVISRDDRGPMGPTRLSMSKPVIAAIEGYAVAGGLELALWCDLRIVDETAVFGVYCRRWGVPLIDGGTVRLSRVVGTGRALDMILTGRPVDALEAQSFGLSTEVVGAGDARRRAEELAAHLATFPQGCLRSDRRSTLEQDGLDLEAALANERRHGLAAAAVEALPGAARFSSGVGRHGDFSAAVSRRRRHVVTAAAAHRTPGSARSAIVTGGSRGIGLAVVDRLVRDGLAVAILDLDEPRAEAAVEQIVAAGGAAIAVGTDVRDASSVQSAVDRVAAKLGPPSVLVNNAGVLRDNLLHKMSDDDWDAVLDVHLRGAFLVTRAVQRHMVDAAWGRIVNISSIAASGNRGQTNYSAAKAGLMGMTRTHAIELGRFGVTANVVAPGFIETEMTRATAQRLGVSFDDFKATVADGTAVGRVGTPDDVASAVAYLVSEEAGYVTGQTLCVSGGPS